MSIPQLHVREPQIPLEEMETETWFSRSFQHAGARQRRPGADRAGIVLAVPADDGGMDCLTMLSGTAPCQFSDVVPWPGKRLMRCLVFRFHADGETELLGEVPMKSEARAGETWIHVQARWDGARAGVSVSHLGTGEVGRARFKVR